MMVWLHDLWSRRDLIRAFVLRDIKARYKQTLLGVSWAVVQPLSMTAAFTVIFSLFARIPSDGAPYPIFAYCGLVFWTFFANVIANGTVVMVGNAPLIRKIYFPRETLLISSLVAGCLDLAVASSVLLLLMLYHKATLTLAALWVLPLLLLQAIFALGVVGLTSAAYVSFRDIGHALPLVIQLWMFATPVAYPMSVVPAWLLPAYRLNPMTTIIDGYRRALLQGVGPDPAALALGALGILAFAGLSLTVFKRVERTFADVI
jgi:ABC-type polysaccharide/polyol phosphate export permease